MSGVPALQIAYGEVPGAPMGTTVRDRRALREAGLHRPLQAGIDFAPGRPAASVVLSGVYPDDDRGDLVVYTGQGGLLPGTSKAVADQKPILGNAALVRNRNLGIPIRLVRRMPQGFRYDGLYSVDDYFRERHASDGYVRWRYRLQKTMSSAVLVIRDQSHVTTRVEQTIQRIVRDTAVSRAVKRMYEYTCQVCDICLPTPIAPYAEAAHIRPLGWPHNGPDDLGNVLCLCPNDHVLFDYGAITVIPETLVATGDRSVEGRRLTVRRNHLIDPAHLDYHREAVFIPIRERPDR